MRASIGTAFTFFMIALGAAFSPSRAETTTPAIEIIEWGIYGATPVVGRVPSDTLAGYGNLLDPNIEVPLIEKTVEIPACIGTRFGIKYRTSSGWSAPVKIVVKHPMQTAPDGRTKSESSWDDVARAVVGYTGWHFEENYELVEGEWTFNVVINGNVVAAKTFNVTRAPCRLIS